MSATTGSLLRREFPAPRARCSAGVGIAAALLFASGIAAADESTPPPVANADTSDVATDSAQPPAHEAANATPGDAAQENAPAEAVATTAAVTPGKSMFVCSYEKPTGSRVAVKVCRARSAIEEDAEISRRSLGRSQHYGNAGFSPPD